MRSCVFALVVVLLSSHAASAAVHAPRAREVSHRVVDESETFRAREKARLRAHFEVVQRELANADTSHLDDGQLLARARMVDTLRAYAASGRFPQNRGHAPFTTPIFVDDDGVHCAMGHLLAETGAAALVDEIRATRNLAYIADLADDPRLHAWLDVHGLSLEEAGRIQPGYSTEETMVAGLCRLPTLFEVSQPDLAIVLVDVEITTDLDGCLFDTCRRVKGDVLGLVETILPCTDEPCASRFTEVTGREMQLPVARFLEGEKRRSLAFVSVVEDDVVVDGQGTFAEDALYGDNADGYGWLVMAAGPLVHIPDDVLEGALTAGSLTGCLDVLLAHDAEALCTIGLLPEMRSAAADAADAACAAALAEPDDEEDDDDDETGLGPDDEPGADDEASPLIACAAVPGALTGLAPFALLLATRRRRRSRG